MGTMHHHAIIATTWNKIEWDKAITWIKDKQDENDEQGQEGGSWLIQEVMCINGYRTICLAPDGSKEYWKRSDKGDALRSEFTAFLYQARYEDGSSPWDCVEVDFGELGTGIARK